MRPKQRREMEREELRGKILDAARELFLTHGYDAVTMRRIAEKIGYSATALYFHFRDKEALMRELCDCDFAALAAEFGAIAGIADPLERLRATGSAYAAFGLRNPNQYRLMFMTPHPPSKPEEHAIKRGNPVEDAYAFLRAIVVELLQRPGIPAPLRDAELVSQTVWAGVHGVVSLEIAKSDDGWVDWAPIGERLDAVLDVLLAPFAAAPAATPKKPVKPSAKANKGGKRG